MYKGASQKQQFFERSGSFATHGTRTGIDHLAPVVDEQLTAVQRKAALHAARQRLEEESSAISKLLSSKNDTLTVEEKAALGARRREIRAKIEEVAVLQQAANKEIKSDRPADDISDFLIEVMRERLTKPEWAAVVKEARRRLDAQQSLRQESA